MSRFFEPDLTTKPDSPFVRDASSKLVRRSYWMDMSRFFEPDLTTKPDSPFGRDASSKLVRRSYWMDMPEEAGLVLDRLGVLSFHRS